MKRILLISTFFILGIDFAQIGTFDPTFNEGNPYQFSNNL